MQGREVSRELCQLEACLFDQVLTPGGGDVCGHLHAAQATHQLAQVGGIEVLGGGVGGWRGQGQGQGVCVQGRVEGAGGEGRQVGGGLKGAGGQKWVQGAGGGEWVGGWVDIDGAGGPIAYREAGF